MHSSTSSSSGSVFERSLPEAKRWHQILLGTILLLTTGLACMECYARSTGTPPQFDTTPDLWVTQWYRFEEAPNDQTVIIGASRNKFGLILNRWEELTKVQPIMLAWPGSPPHPVLELLAEDKEFSGTVICGIAPSFSFASADNSSQSYMRNNISLIDVNRWSLSYHVTISIQRFLKRNVHCWKPVDYSPLYLLQRLELVKDRAGVLAPIPAVPWMSHGQDLQSTYRDGSADNKEMMAQVTAFWRRIMLEQEFLGPIDMNQLLFTYRTCIEKIEGRGGKVIFVRHPSSGRMLEFEKMHYPRELYFDRLIVETGCMGIHFEDYPEISEYECPEWSHLLPDDAHDYTEKIIQIIEGQQTLKESTNVGKPE